ncbi:SAVED domain-containing protein [Herbiconiux sp. CPCC 203407]|uniref:SAVED domain-containing protein n=1 Tax=Herbiconiux oxytropis TaxID=2970915 RepID=A0AA41XGN1_9MICO|nr:SAVED domain-containing protein [Herbiconiux oxytropis]MCS5721494.1 SAVED domain-containing protein [Herbiconiux oxytropis]MCS5724571.1 SAVED domain-containing protein [Herbiconiux oxytropis]
MTRPPTHIELHIDAYETIASETANHLPRETGGILLGYQENGSIVATHAMVVEGRESTTNRYVRDDVRANDLLKEFLEQRSVDDPTGYIGEWHSHPFPSEPSPVDHAAMRAIAKGSSNSIALLVFAPGETDTFFGLIARRQRFGRATTKGATLSLPPARFAPLGPLPNGAVRGDGPVFISYRQTDGTAQADALEDLLRAAGLVVWRDHTDLRPGTTTDRLEQALTRGLSAGVLVVSPDIANSDIVRERELPRLLQLDANPDFSLCIANTIARAGEESKCDYDAPDRLLRLVPARTLADKKQSNMLQPSGELEIVRDLLMHRIEQRKPIIRAEERDFIIRVQSRPAASALDADKDDLHIRLRPSDDGRLPSRAGLELLRKTLPLTSDAVYAADARRVRISGGAHLSVALALGAALPETKLGKLVVIDTEGTEWASAAPDDDPQNTQLRTDPIQFQRDQTTPLKHRVAVFVTLTPQADQSAFKQLVHDSATGFDAAKLIAIRGTERIDPREAARLSADVAQQIKRFSASQGRAEVHLAFHGPYTMAVLIGRYLNTLRTTIYEWDGNSEDGARYRPVIVLEPGVANGPITDVLA